MSNIPLPSGIDAAQRRFREIQSAIDTTGTRTLENASISQGNLRVRHGGNIIIGDGGTLNITGGDLILGKGKIQGDALADQFEAVNVSAASSQNRVSLRAGRTTVRTQQVTPPAWCRQVIIFVTWHAYVITDVTANTPNLAARFNAGGKASVEYLMEFSFEDWEGTQARLDANGTFLTSIAGAAPFSAAIEVRSSKAASLPVRTGFDAACLFLRHS